MHLHLLPRALPTVSCVRCGSCGFLCRPVPTGSSSRGGDVAVYAFDMNQPSLPTPFYSVLVSVSVFMALSTVFHSINFSDNFLLSHFVLPVLFLPHWSFQLYISLSLRHPRQPWYDPLRLTGLKASTNWLTDCVGSQNKIGHRAHSRRRLLQVPVLSARGI